MVFLAYLPGDKRYKRIQITSVFRSFFNLFGLTVWVAIHFDPKKCWRNCWPCWSARGHLPADCGQGGQHNETWEKKRNHGVGPTGKCYLVNMRAIPGLPKKMFKKSCKVCLIMNDPRPMHMCLWTVPMTSLVLGWRCEVHGGGIDLVLSVHRGWAEVDSLVLSWVEISEAGCESERMRTGSKLWFSFPCLGNIQIW